jgi:hypothetical protein
MWDDGDYYDASFSIHKSRRYHARLRDFYQTLHNYTTGLNAFAASGAFVAFLGSLTNFAAALSAIVALASLFDSLFQYDSRARLHHDLCARFTRTAAEIETLPETPQSLAHVRSERLKMECDEPAEKRLVERMAENDEARSRGVPESELIHLSKPQRILGYFFTYNMAHLERQRAAREARRAAAANSTVQQPAATTSAPSS